MSDRIAEIRARLDGESWVSDDFISRAPVDIAWLLERESQAMGALRMLSVLALHCCDAAIGRASLDECLRDFGFTLDEVEARDER